MTSRNSNAIIIPYSTPLNSVRTHCKCQESKLLLNSWHHGDCWKLVTRISTTMHDLLAPVAPAVHGVALTSFDIARDNIACTLECRRRHHVEWYGSRFNRSQNGSRAEKAHFVLLRLTVSCLCRHCWFWRTESAHQPFTISSGEAGVVIEPDKCPFSWWETVMRAVIPNLRPCTYLCPEPSAFWIPSTLKCYKTKGSRWSKGSRWCVLRPDFMDSTGLSSITGCDGRASQTQEPPWALHSALARKSWRSSACEAGPLQPGAGWWAPLPALRAEHLGKGCDSVALKTVMDDAVSWLSSDWLSGH